jgi:spore germination cell wall hydrolase CwlJ-like protein
MRKFFISLCVAIPLYISSCTNVGAFTVLNQAHERQVECLAENIYHEAKGESMKGQMAVAIVTMNRLGIPDFPGDVCEIIQQKSKHTCQFSWYCNKKQRNYFKKKDNRKDILYVKSRYVAEYVYLNYQNIKDPTNGALYYHAEYVKVKRKGKVKKAVIGKHIFYDIKQKKKV